VVEQLGFFFKREAADEIGDALGDGPGGIEIERLGCRLRDRDGSAGSECDADEVSADRNEACCERAIVHDNSLS
jgi:hypothetical protein